MLSHKIKLYTAVLFISLALVTPVFSHGDLRSSQPEPGETLHSSPETIDLTFNEPIYSGTINLVQSGGNTIPLTLLKHDRPDMLVARVEDTLEDGEYSVLWVATSEDSHTINGSYRFAVETADDNFTTIAIVGTIALMGLGVAGWRLLRSKQVT
jgi:methionine-rich copper-binding protein CopC